MPMPSTKPSSSTYISTAKPMIRYHTTGSTYSTAMLMSHLFVAERQRPRGGAHDAWLRRRHRTHAQHLQKIPSDETEHEQIDHDVDNQRGQHTACRHIGARCIHRAQQ